MPSCYNKPCHITLLLIILAEVKVFRKSFGHFRINMYLCIHLCHKVVSHKVVTWCNTLIINLYAKYANPFFVYLLSK